METDDQSIVSAMCTVQQKHAETLVALRDTINQLRQTIADAIRLREAQVKPSSNSLDTECDWHKSIHEIFQRVCNHKKQDDARCQSRVLQVKMLYGRVQGLEQELEKHVADSDGLVASVRESADTKVRWRPWPAGGHRWRCITACHYEYS